MSALDLDALQERALRTDQDAREAMHSYVDAWLGQKLGAHPEFTLCRDGEDSWSFWVLEDDTTSYVHADGRFEWYGTSWEPGQEDS